MNPELSQNLQALAKRFPSVIEELKAYAAEPASTAEFEAFLHRVYANPADIDAWAGQVRETPHRVWVTGGLGDGSHLRKLLLELPSSSRICVLEAETGLLLQLLQRQDVRDLLSHPRFILLTPFSYRDVIQRLNLELVGIQSAAQLRFAPLHERNAGLYQNLTEAVMRQLTIRWNQLRTDISHAEQVFSNTLQNLAQHQLGIEITAMRGIFQGRAMVLVGAGPSLDESFDFLRAAQGRACIAVVNSAYRAVTRQGIRPDITVAVDPHEGTFRGYEHTQTDHPFLVSAYVVYPKVPELFPDRVIPLSSYNAVMTLLRRVLKLPEEPGIVGDGTVSCTVVNLAAYLGCNEVYLVGQDMAIRADGQAHVSDSFYSDDADNHIEPASCEWLPGNEGHPVPVEKKLHAYLRIFENLVSHYAGLRFHNLARTGARIHGAPYVPIEQAIQQVQALPQHHFHAELSARAERARLPAPVFEAVKRVFFKYDQFLENFLKATLSFAVEGEQWVMQGNATAPVQSLQAKRQQILDLMQQNPLFSTLLGEGRTKTEYHDFICAEEPWKLINDPTATIPEMLPQVWAFVEGAVFQRDLIQTHLLAPRQAQS